MLQIRKFLEHISRPIIPDFHDISYYAFQHHLEHIGIASILTIVFLLLGIPNLIASILVMVAWFIFKNMQGGKPLWRKELPDILDAVTDCNQYCFTFVITSYIEGETTMSFIIFTMLIIIYYTTYEWTNP